MVIVFGQQHFGAADERFFAFLPYRRGAAERFAGDDQHGNPAARSIPHAQVAAVPDFAGGGGYQAVAFGREALEVRDGGRDQLAPVLPPPSRGSRCSAA